MSRRLRSSPDVTEAITLLRASLLANQIETAALHVSLMPKYSTGRDDALSALDDARELMRALHPAAVDPASTGLLSRHTNRNEFPVA